MVTGLRPKAERTRVRSANLTGGSTRHLAVLPRYVQSSASQSTPNDYLRITRI